jgi:hypothetical protein
VLIERLLALVPRPRKHLVTYHGVLAPGASLRHRVALVHESQRCSRRVPIWGFPDPVTSHAEHQVPSPSQVQDEVSGRQLG